VLGRVVASSRFIGSIAFVVGPVAGGLLGEWIGVRQAILVAAVLHVAYPAVVWRSPLRSMPSIPEAETPVS
jgi:MFS family permease